MYNYHHDHLSSHCVAKHSTQPPTSCWSTPYHTTNHLMLEYTLAHNHPPQAGVHLRTQPPTSCWSTPYHTTTHLMLEYALPHNHPQQAGVHLTTQPPTSCWSTPYHSCTESPPSPSSKCRAMALLFIVIPLCCSSSRLSM